MRETARGGQIKSERGGGAVGRKGFDGAANFVFFWGEMKLVWYCASYAFCAVRAIAFSLSLSLTIY